MGLANLVPGISGGTMLLASGIYTRFIDAVASVSRLRLRADALRLLFVVGAAAAFGIILFAGPIKDLVLGHRWVMYSLFVGLTLGGIPALWHMARPGSAPLWAGAFAGFVGMAVLGELQRAGAAGGAGDGGFGILFVAGVAAASSMILPGVSGGYVLLVLGQYVTLLAAIEAAVDAVRATDVGAFLAPALSVFLPVGLGVLAGVAGVSNLLRWLLRRYRPATLGVLLGLLAGAVVGLWPFQQAVPPEAGTRLQGRILRQADLPTIAAEDWPVRTFTPSPAQVAGALGLIGVGFAVTGVIARLGREGDG